jgi:glycerol-3-phosphate O-acyltransferase
MMGQAPIFRFNSQRQEIVEKTVERVVATTRDAVHVLNDAAFHETRRLDGSKRPKDIERLEGWRALARRLGRMSDAERVAKLREIAAEYAEDIAGNFDPRVYKLSTRLVPTLVTGLLSPSALARMVREPSQLFSVEGLADKVVVQGDVERLRKLAQIGTLIFVPTHSSNLDSIVFGFALERSRLPPATYGAGKNLFTNPLLSFFMHNLGAYKVDRRLRHELYKDCLKTYSTILVENGYHSLFFPGGTRSRSGGVEQRLKLGLMGTGLEAYTRTLMAGRERKVFFVPATINYLIALEAETLIADFLSEAGKARYIIEDDESTRLGRMAAFTRKALGMDASVVIRFGQPLDPFGLVVDDEGTSYDRRGRAVETASYVKDLDGNVGIVAARDAQYTRELGREIAAAYKRETVVMPTHLVAAAAFDHLRRQSPSADLFTVLRLRDEIISRDDLSREVLRVREELVDLEKSGNVVLAESLRHASGGDVVAQAMRAFRGYHTTPVIEPRPDGIALRDTNLLFYYQNRLVEHGFGWNPHRVPAAPHGPSLAAVGRSA